MSSYKAYLFPDSLASGTGSWAIDDPVNVQHVLNPDTPLGSSYIFADHRDDGDQVRYNLDQVDLYTGGYNYIAVHIWQNGAPSQEMGVKLRFEHFSGATFLETSFPGNTYAPEWQTQVFDLGGDTYSSADINNMQLWLTAPNPCGEFEIYSVYVEVIGEDNYTQFDPDNFIRIGDCSGLNRTHLYGGLILNGDAYYYNGKIRYGDGGLKLGDLQPRIADGGIIIESEISYSSAISGRGGVVCGGSASIQTVSNETGTGGVICGSPTYPNGYKVRVPITVFAGDEAALGILLGWAVYIPSHWASYDEYTVEDGNGNTLPFEVVNTTGNRISLFAKVNVYDTDKTIYFFAK